MDLRPSNPGATIKSWLSRCLSLASGRDSPPQSRWPLFPPPGKLSRSGDRAASVAYERHLLVGGTELWCGSTSRLSSAGRGRRGAWRDRKPGSLVPRAFLPRPLGLPPSPPRAKFRPGGCPRAHSHQGRAATSVVVGIGGTFAPARRCIPGPPVGIGDRIRSTPRSPLSN